MRSSFSWILFGLSILGVGALTIAFLQTLAPNPQTLAARPSVPMPTLQPGQFVYVKNPAESKDWPTEYLFIRTNDGLLRVFEISIKLGRVSLPDKNWWRPAHICRIFGPNFKSNQFECRDPNTPQWVRDKFRWNLEGKSLAPHVVENMPIVTGTVEAGSYIIKSVI